ncbi:MAG: alpha/beta hydrolase [Actinomycetota bacterium]|nr:alpha/beta hydrolase [Actinomycetota bacterium]MDQ3719470.1 alpha/beta hydrolase [Actinomycetota bacterium]
MDVGAVGTHLPTPTEIELELPSGVTLRGADAGAGPPVVLLHGLSATRRHVLQGSSHLLRSGYRLIGYDARGHGISDPAPRRDAYEYSDLSTDLDAVLDHLGLERFVLAGSSMGAATAMAWALPQPERIQAMVQITPAYGGAPRTDGIDKDLFWTQMADALADGPERFAEEALPHDMPEEWRETAKEATIQRMEAHRDLEAVADAMRVVPWSKAFDGMRQIERLEVPTLVVGSRDEYDALHPLEVAEAYARRIPNAELLVEDEGNPPIAWQGARLSRAVEHFLIRNGIE